MALKNNLSCFLMLGLFVMVSKAGKNYLTKDKQFIKEVIDIHNELRGKVQPTAANMKYLNWDKGLAGLAKFWSMQCKFLHNPCADKRFGCLAAYEFVGENLWQGLISAMTPRNIITSWFNESKNFDFEMISCSNVCGHYTQVVWANTQKVGCAASNCPGSKGIFVCNYGPSGNFANTRPYEKGESCAMCEKHEVCINKVCQDIRGRASHPTAYLLLILGFILQRLI